MNNLTHNLLDSALEIADRYDNSNVSLNNIALGIGVGLQLVQDLASRERIIKNSSSEKTE